MIRQRIHRQHIACWFTLLLLLAGFSVPSSASLVIEAENVPIHTAGTGMNIDGGWKQYSNGEFGTYIKCEKSAKYQVVVNAAGTPAVNVWPLMGLLLDGTTVDTVSVEQRDWKAYTFSKTLSAGVHKLTLSFTNDALINGEDRNLLVDNVTITPLAAGIADPRVASDEEVASYKANNIANLQHADDETLRETNARIEKYRKGDARVRIVDAQGRPVAGARIVVDQTQHDFLFGCNIFMLNHFKTPEENAAYAQRFAELFNYCTVPFYWRGYEPVRGQPNYASTEPIVAWCIQHKIQMKGHPLLWGNKAGIPTWLDGVPAAEVQQQRVADIIGRFTGRINRWEVVNEPAHLASIPIDNPYRWAHQDDPNAYLIVNDYDVMHSGCPAFFQLLQQAKQNGVPFNGIGIQAHEPTTMRFPLGQVYRILNQYATLGKDLHITEFSPTSGGQQITGPYEGGVWDEATQAEYAEKFYRICFSHPAVVAITWWDLCDNGSWLPGGGMLRKNLTPKPVYTALHKLITEEWHTHAEGKTDKRGDFSFRGFYGTYHVVVPGKTVVSSDVHVAKGDAQIMTIRVQ